MPTPKPAWFVARLTAAAPDLHVSGNQLLDASNHVVVLRGVNRSGPEYACIQGWGIFDGDNVMNDDSQVPLMAAWGVNEVNLGVNEDCWLNINGVAAAYGGPNYINALVHETQTLESYGITPVISLFWEAAGSTQATDQIAMPDNDHAPALWQSVANTFKNDHKVVFRLKEEPYPAGNTDGAAAWQCWKNGDVQYGASGSLTPVSSNTNCSEGYTALGMQSLINIIRGTGASNVIQVPGVEYANSMTHFLDSAYRVSDTEVPAQLMGVVDVYPVGNICGSTSCYDQEYLPVIQQMPLLAGEFGESVDGGACTTTNADALMSWFDGNGAGYSAWSWDTWGGCLQLISSYSSGAPNGNWGNDYKNHLLALASSAPARALIMNAYGTAVPTSGVQAQGAGWTWPIARGIVLRPGTTSGYLLDGYGGVHPFGGAAAVTMTGYWPGWDIARAVALNPCDSGGGSGYVLDGFGGIHPFGGAPAINITGYWPGWDIAHALALNSCAGGEVSGYVLDGYGGVHPFWQEGGSTLATPSITGYWRGWDIARAIVVTSDGQGEVLDGWGNLHPFGGGPFLATSAQWRGWDIARALSYSASLGGGYVLDGFGNVHQYGAAPALSPEDDWMGSDIARSVAIYT